MCEQRCDLWSKHIEIAASCVLAKRGKNNIVDKTSIHLPWRMGSLPVATSGSVSPPLASIKTNTMGPDNGAPSGLPTCRGRLPGGHHYPLALGVVLERVVTIHTYQCTK